MDSAPLYVCEFPGCGRSFDTKTGRGLHHRRGHPDWTDQRQNILAVKARWNEEETRLLAEKEVELLRSGIKFVNQALLPFFPERSLEAIKGKRKQLAYRQLVSNLMEEVPDNVANNGNNELPINEDRYREVIRNYVESLPTTKIKDFGMVRLVSMCSKLRTTTPDVMLDELSLYLRDVFPPGKGKVKTYAKTCDTPTVSRRQQRKIDYAKTQDLWRKHRGKCLRMILNDITGVVYPSKENMVPYWREIMTAPKDCSPGIMEDRTRPVIKELWSSIQESEIKKAMPNNSTAPGPDGISVRLAKKIPMEVLVRMLNIVLWCGKMPKKLLESVTTLIPKKSEAGSPADFRPISVASVLVRVLHRILASRLSRYVHLDQRQRAFRPTDGCSDNVFHLDLVLRQHHKQHKPLFMASLDIAKAFDSVSHKTIQETLETLEIMGVPQPMTQYIMDVYNNSTTKLTCNGWTSDHIKPLCGVKQGDPMSPLIFNMVIDRLLARLPEDIGAKVGDLTINAAAFADDLLLFASTPMGLQQLLNRSTRYLESCGLMVNASKCMTVALRNVPHEKKTVVDKETVFLCGKRLLPSLKRTDEWKYLGIPFTPEGRAQGKAKEKLLASIEKLTKAPLKPQQRVYALRTMVIPGLYHQLELGNTTISVLRKCDTILRQAVRRWLALPADVPNAYIHANTKHGGLGIASFRWHVPLRRLKRLERLPLAAVHATSTPGAFLKKEIMQCEICLRNDQRQLKSAEDIDRKWSTQLYSMVDGAGLKEAGRVPRQHDWIQDGTRFLSGKDYLQSCRLRINSLPTRSRITRGRANDRMCRAGCNKIETLNHVLQQCHRTHGIRIKRHDNLVAYVARGLEVAEYQVSVEPKLQTAAGIRKPDIVARRGVLGLVIDAQVINDQYDLDTAHENKIEYYKDIVENIKDKYQVENVIVTSITLSWRGIWSEASATSLLDLGVIKKKTLKIMSSRVIIGGLCGFNYFGKMTNIRTTTASRMRRTEAAQNA